MKKSKEEAAKTRRRIVEVAAEEFRRNGIQETGVAEIMASAGLTSGGFYRHFESKDQLVAEACALSMHNFVNTSKKAIELGDEAFVSHIEHFLSKQHCEGVAEGCPLVFIGSELARADMGTRRVVSQEYRELVDVIASHDQYLDDPSSRAKAIFTLSAMIGAVTIARIADTPKLSALILDETKNYLTSQFKGKKRKSSRMPPLTSRKK